MVLTSPSYNLSPTLIVTFPLKSSVTLMINEVFCSTVTFKAVTSATKVALATVNFVEFLLPSYLSSPAKTTLTS